MLMTPTDTAPGAKLKRQKAKNLEKKKKEKRKEKTKQFFCIYRLSQTRPPKSFFSLCVVNIFCAKRSENKGTKIGKHAIRNSSGRKI